MGSSSVSTSSGITWGPVWGPPRSSSGGDTGPEGPRTGPHQAQQHGPDAASAGLAPQQRGCALHGQARRWALCVPKPTVSRRTSVAYCAWLSRRMGGQRLRKGLAEGVTAEQRPRVAGRGSQAHVQDTSFSARGRGREKAPRQTALVCLGMAGRGGGGGSAESEEEQAGSGAGDAAGAEDTGTRTPGSGLGSAWM